MRCEVCGKQLLPAQERKKLGGKYCCFGEECVYLIEKSRLWTFTPQQAKQLLDELFDARDAA